MVKRERHTQTDAHTLTTFSPHRVFEEYARAKAKTNSVVDLLCCGCAVKRVKKSREEIFLLFFPPVEYFFFFSTFFPPVFPSHRRVFFRVLDFHEREREREELSTYDDDDQRKKIEENDDPAKSRAPTRARADDDGSRSSSTSRIEFSRRAKRTENASHLLDSKENARKFYVRR